MNTKIRLLIDGLFFLMAKELKNTDWWLDMERLFSLEFVARLDDRERILAYEAVKRELRERNASQEEYNRVTDQAIEELEI